MQRNAYVLTNMFGSFFLATVITALIAQLGNIADSIVMGHLVSPDALSVVRIWLPVENFMFIVIGLMSAGACLLSARGIYSLTCCSAASSSIESPKKSTTGKKILSQTNIASA